MDWETLSSEDVGENAISSCEIFCKEAFLSDDSVGTDDSKYESPMPAGDPEIPRLSPVSEPDTPLDAMFSREPAWDELYDSASPRASITSVDDLDVPSLQSITFPERRCSSVSISSESGGLKIATPRGVTPAGDWPRVVLPASPLALRADDFQRVAMGQKYSEVDAPRPRTTKVPSNFVVLGSPSIDPLRSPALRPNITLQMGSPRQDDRIPMGVPLVQRSQTGSIPCRSARVLPAWHHSQHDLRRPASGMNPEWRHSQAAEVKWPPIAHHPSLVRLSPSVVRSSQFPSALRGPAYASSITRFNSDGYATTLPARLQPPPDLGFRSGIVRTGGVQQATYPPNVLLQTVPRPQNSRFTPRNVTLRASETPPVRQPCGQSTRRVLESNVTSSRLLGPRIGLDASGTGRRLMLDRGGPLLRPQTRHILDPPVAARAPLGMHPQATPSPLSFAPARSVRPSRPMYREARAPMNLSHQAMGYCTSARAKSSGFGQPSGQPRMQSFSKALGYTSSHPCMPSSSKASGHPCMPSSSKASGHPCMPSSSKASGHPYMPSSSKASAASDGYFPQYAPRIVLDSRFR